MPTMTIGRTALAGAATLATALLLTGCSLLGGGADRDETTGQVTEAAQEDVFSMQVGDCLNEPDGTEVSDVELVPCSEPHDYEVYAETTLPEGDYPADLDQQAEDFCAAEFTNFIGVDYNESQYYFTFFTPTEQGWNEADDRLIQCMVLDQAGQTTGSLEGANA